MDIDAVVRLRIAIIRLARQFNASATGEGLSPSQASVLGVISGRGPLSLARLTEIEGLHPTMVSRVVGFLDEAGLIRRAPSAQDLRVVMVEATQEGRAANERIKAERAKVVSDCLDRLSENDREAIVTLLPALEALAGELRSDR